MGTPSEEDFADAYIDELARRASEFWHAYHTKDANRQHICDISLEELRARHKNVLRLREKYDSCDIGLLLAGEYQGVWTSRSCSAHMAELIGGDYLDYYCAGGSYYTLRTESIFRELIKDFDMAMGADMRGLL